MFTINHNEAYQGSSLIPEGEYEIIVKKCEEKDTKSGITYINMQLAIRNDVDQKYKNKVIFHSIWKAKATGDYNPKAFNTISKGLEIPNGTVYKNMEELLNGFVGKTARITIKHEEYNGKTTERVAFWNPTKFKECNHKLETSLEDYHPAETDLPF